MATVFGHVSVQYLDHLGVTVSSPVYFNIDDTSTVAALVSLATTTGDTIDPITDAQLTKLTVEIDAPLSVAVKTAPAATAENERTGVFNFRQSASPYKYAVIVPSIANSKITNGKINLSDTQIQAFITFLTTAGIVATAVSTAIKALIAFADALISFRKHRKSETRRSIES